MKKLISYEIRKLATILKAASIYEIAWSEPDFVEESGEYFENIKAIEFFKKRGISFKSEQELVSLLRKGKLVDMPLEKVHNYSSIREFFKEIQNSEYAKSFHSMKKYLESYKKIKLPAPIFIKISHTGDIWCLSGNRRINFAKYFKLPIKVWLLVI